MEGSAADCPIAQAIRGAKPSAQLSSERIHSGKIIELDRDTVRYPNGSEAQLEIRPRPGEGYIWNCATVDEHRRKGIFRSLLVGVHRGDHLIYVGRVGTGYSADKTKRLVPRLKELAADKSPFTGQNAPRAEREAEFPIDRFEFREALANSAI